MEAEGVSRWDQSGLCYSILKSRCAQVFCCTVCHPTPPHSSADSTLLSRSQALTHYITTIKSIFSLQRTVIACALAVIMTLWQWTCCTCVAVFAIVRLCHTISTPKPHNYIASTLAQLVVPVMEEHWGVSERQVKKRRTSGGEDCLFTCLL